jgi:hypothetical protein
MSGDSLARIADLKVAGATVASLETGVEICNEHHNHSASRLFHPQMKITLQPSHKFHFIP